MSHNNSSQTDVMRSVEAHRAAEILLSTSQASSVSSSAHSRTSSLPSYSSYINQYQSPYTNQYHLPHINQYQPPHNYTNQYQSPYSNQYQLHHINQYEPPPPEQSVSSSSGPVSQSQDQLLPTLAPPYYQLPPFLSHLHYRGTGHQFPVVMTDDLVSGTKHGGGLSPVRRFFVLLCLFDILFISFLWIIAILVSGRDLVGDLHEQVMEYTIHSSMFDCVAVAAVRFLVCLTFYGMLSMSHWVPIMITTATTVGFLLGKVFQYQWQTGDPITYDVMMILLSFVLAWGEVWFFDFRMIPLEQKASEVLGAQSWMGRRRGMEENERTPLLSNSGGGMVQMFIEGSTLYEGSVGHYYSPVETPEHSDEEDDTNIGVIEVKIPKRFRRNIINYPFSSQEREYIKIGGKFLAAAWSTMNTSAWKLEKQLDTGDLVEGKEVNGRKFFRLTGYLNISAKKLLEELFYKIELVPRWYPTLVDCRIIQPIDEHTDITYQVCAEAVGGLVAARDFVNLRHWEEIDGVYVSAGGSITHLAMPSQPQRVRGENGPGCFAIRPVQENPTQCLFQWLLNVDLKGWIPEIIVEKALIGALCDYISHLRTRTATVAWNEN